MKRKKIKILLTLMAISSIGFAQKTLSLDSLITRTDVISFSSQTPKFTYCNIVNEVVDTSSFTVPKGYIANVQFYEGSQNSNNYKFIGVCINDSFMINKDIKYTGLSSHRHNDLWITAGDKINRVIYDSGRNIAGQSYVFWEIKLFKLE